MKKYIQHYIKNIKTFFYTLVGWHFKIDEMKWTIKRILGFQEFLDYKKIEEYITSIDTEQNFDKNKAMLFEEQDGLRLWLIASNTDMFIVRDNGLHDLKILLKRNKTDFKSKIIFEKNEPRLYIENTTTTLPFDTNLTGGTESFQTTIENFKK